MSRKLMITTVLALVMVLMVGVTVYAHGPGPVNTQAGAAAGDPAAVQTFQGGGQQMLQLHDGSAGCEDFVDEDGDGLCDNAAMDGTGSGTMTRQGVRANQQVGAAGQNQAQAKGRSMNQGMGQGLGTEYVDADGDGDCDNFVDADGDGVSDIAPQDGTGSQFGRSQGQRGQGRNR